MANVDGMRIYKGFVPYYTADTVRNPPEFSGWMDEQMSWKTNCYLGDWSFVPEIGIKAPMR